MNAFLFCLIAICAELYFVYMISDRYSDNDKVVTKALRSVIDSRNYSNYNFFNMYCKV